jgi:hypothetical protein
MSPTTANVEPIDAPESGICANNNQFSGGIDDVPGIVG